MLCEIRISGPWPDLRRLTLRLADFAPRLVRPGMDRAGQARLSWRVAEKKLDAQLIVLARVLDAVETERAADFSIQVRNLQGSEPPAGSDQFVEKFRPIPGLTIQPWSPDLPGPPDPDTVVLDPDTAFGTGKHPSTRLCLELLAQLAENRKPDRMLLDLGCGTGVLAIAALKLGAVSAAQAVDIDAAAVRVAAANVELNGLGDRITIRRGSWDAVCGRFDLIVANLVPSVLLAVGAGISRHLQERGSVVVAGFRSGQTTMVTDFLAGQGLQRVCGRADREGWTALHLE
jgi:ribosomal protein L11 methyltransferase